MRWDPRQVKRSQLIIIIIIVLQRYFGPTECWVGLEELGGEWSPNQMILCYVPCLCVALFLYSTVICTVHVLLLLLTFLLHSEALSSWYILFADSINIPLTKNPFVDQHNIYSIKSKTPLFSLQIVPFCCDQTTTTAGQI